MSEENTEGVVEQQVDDEIMSTLHGPNQSSWQKPGIEIGLSEHKYCQWTQKGTENHGTK